MSASLQAPVVHLELHTNDLPSARDLYGELCGWAPDRVDTSDRQLSAVDAAAVDALPEGHALLVEDLCDSGTRVEKRR